MQARGLHGLFIVLLAAWLWLNPVVIHGGKLYAGLLVYVLLIAALLWLADRVSWLVSVAALAALVVVTGLTLQLGASPGLSGLVTLPLLAAALMRPPRETAALAALAVVGLVLAAPDTYSRWSQFFFVAPGLIALSVVMAQRFGIDGLRQRILKLELMDPMTGVHNVRAFRNLLERTHALAKRQGHPYSVVAIDFVGLAAVNQKFGRDVGNRCLQQLAETLDDMTRGTDVLGRAGGGEFLLLLPDADREAAGIAARRVRDEVSKTEVKVRKIKLQLAVHIGYASCPEDEQNTSDIIDHADRQLEMDRTMRHKSSPTWV